MSWNVLLVGLGQIGMSYDAHLDPNNYIYTHARAFNIHPDFQLVAGVDPSEKKRIDFESNYGTPSYADISTALHDHQPEIVVIAVPTQLHCVTLIRILEKVHPIAILCEKPLSYCISEARLMVESCAKKSIRLYVNYIRRSDPAMVEVKNRIEAQKFAGPIKGQVWYTNGFMNNGSHFFNLLEYWLGSMTAFKDITLNNSLENDDFDIDVTVSFMKGSVSFSSLWEPAYSYHSVELFAQNGRMLYRQGIPYVSWQQSQADPRFKSYMALVRKPERIMLDMDKYQFNVVDQISADLKRVKSSVCCSTDALHTLRSMQKIVSKVA